MLRLSEAFERLFQRAELAAERGDLLVQKLDLRQRALAHLLLGLRGRLRAPRCGPTPRLRPRRSLSSRPCRRSRSPSVVGEVRLQAGERLLQVARARLLQRQKLGQLGDLRVQAGSTVSLLVTSWPRKNCARMNTESRNTKTSSSVAIASTKPGQ